MNEDEKINGSGLFSFLSKLNKDYMLNVIDWYNGLTDQERDYVNTIRQEAVHEAMFFEANPEF